MNNILAVIDEKNISKEIKENSSYIFNSKTILENIYDTAQSSNLITKIILNKKVLTIQN